MEEMVVGWDRARERGGPAPGPGWQMTPVCRLNVPEGLLVVGGGWEADKVSGQLQRAGFWFNVDV